MKCLRHFQLSIVFKISILALTWMYLTRSAFATTYDDSRDFADYQARLADSENGTLFIDFAKQLSGALAVCGTGVGVTAGAAIADTFPLGFVFKGTKAISIVTTSKLSNLSRVLKLQDLSFVLKFQEALALNIGRFPILTRAMKAAGAKVATTSALAGAPAIGAARLMGAALGLEAEGPQDAADYVDTLAPHFIGGAISSFLDYTVFEIMSSKGWTYFPLPGLDRSRIPRGKLTEEAWRATIVASSLVREGSTCQQLWSDFRAALREALMRSKMVERPATGEIDSASGDTTTDHPTDAGPDLSGFPGTSGPGVSNRTLTHRRYVCPTCRPYGGADYGGRDYEPRESRDTRVIRPN
ncbi:MAG: hypothetical protein AABZ55_06480 [Bdellovibrionota bacterium]